jgi:hypothetical protein
MRRVVDVVLAAVVVDKPGEDLLGDGLAPVRPHPLAQAELLLRVLAAVRQPPGNVSVGKFEVVQGVENPRHRPVRLALDPDRPDVMVAEHRRVAADVVLGRQVLGEEARQRRCAHPMPPRRNRAVQVGQ